MSDPIRRDPSDDAQPIVPDPDDGSTWSTLDGTAEIGDLVNEEDLKNFLVEPIPDPLATNEP